MLSNRYDNPAVRTYPLNRWRSQTPSGAPNTWLCNVLDMTEIGRGFDFPLLHMDTLKNKVQTATTISDGYKDYAAYESMAFYLKDWLAAYRRLERQILELEAMMIARKDETDSGEWPGNVLNKVP